MKGFAVIVALVSAAALVNAAPVPAPQASSPSSQCWTGYCGGKAPWKREPEPAPEPIPEPVPAPQASSPSSQCWTGYCGGKAPWKREE